jgi:hypothetical protein
LPSPPFAYPAEHASRLNHEPTQPITGPASAPHRVLLGGCAGCSDGLIGGDPRRFYYPFMILLLVVIALVLHLAVPVTLVQFSANMSNLGALIYPFLLMYLDSKLPVDDA